MKRGKRVLILLGVLVIAAGAALAASRVKERKEEIAVSGETFLSVPADSVTALSFSDGDTSLAFHRDGTWLWDDDAAFPVDQKKLESLLEPFEDMPAAFVIEDVDDYGQYGLTDPECTVTLTAGEQTTTVKMGAYSTLDQQRYVDIGDGKVYLVADDPREDFDKELSDLIANDELPKLDALASASVAGDTSWSFSRTESGDSYCADDVYFSDAGLPLDTSRVETWLSRIGSVPLTDYVTYNATEEELASYGLDAPDVTVDITPEEGDPIRYSLSEIEPAEDDEDGETMAYLRVGDSKIVYSIAPGDYTILSQCGYNDLRHRELFTPEFDTVASMDVTLEGETYTFTRGEDDDNGEAVWIYNGEEIDIKSLEAAVEALSAQEFTSDAPTDKQEIALTLRLTDEAHPELAISLYRLDGTTCLAQVNGETACTLPRSAAVTLIEAVNALVL